MRLFEKCWFKKGIVYGNWGDCLKIAGIVNGHRGDCSRIVRIVYGHRGDCFQIVVIVRLIVFCVLMILL